MTVEEYKQLWKEAIHLCEIEPDKEFIYDLGDWAAEYADNPYVPMGTYRGYGIITDNKPPYPA